MNNLWTNKKLWIVVVVILLIIIAIITLYTKRPDATPPKPLEVSTTKLQNAQTPSGFPKNLPTESGSKVLQNYESRTNDNRLQSTRKMTSEKDSREALNLYADFFREQGFIGGLDDTASVDGGQQVAQMQNGQNLLMIVVTSVKSGGSEIELTLVQNNK